jgi:hypothetical protein
MIDRNSDRNERSFDTIKSVTSNFYGKCYKQSAIIDYVYKLINIKSIQKEGSVHDCLAAQNNSIIHTADTQVSVLLYVNTLKGLRLRCFVCLQSNEKED